MARTTEKTAPAPVRVAYTRHATAGGDDDRILNAAWVKFLIVMLWIGGIATLCWVLFGGFKLGRATSSAGPVSSPMVIERVVERPAPVPVVATPAPQPTTPSWPSREECERYYVLTLHETPAGRCQ